MLLISLCSSLSSKCDLSKLCHRILVLLLESGGMYCVLCNLQKAVLMSCFDAKDPLALSPSRMPITRSCVISAPAVTIQLLSNPAHLADTSVSLGCHMDTSYATSSLNITLT